MKPAIKWIAILTAVICSLPIVYFIFVFSLLAVGQMTKSGEAPSSETPLQSSASAQRAKTVRSSDFIRVSNELQKFGLREVQPFSFIANRAFTRTQSFEYWVDCLHVDHDRALFFLDEEELNRPRDVGTKMELATALKRALVEEQAKSCLKDDEAVARLSAWEPSSQNEEEASGTSEALQYRVKIYSRSEYGIRASGAVFYHAANNRILSVLVRKRPDTNAGA